MSDSDENDVDDDANESGKKSGKKIQVTMKMVKGWTKRFQVCLCSNFGCRLLGNRYSLS